MTKTLAIGLTLATLMLPGCASIVSGSTDEIEVATNPPGADCILYRDGANIGRINPTPGRLAVARSYSDVTVNCTKPEFEDAAGTAGSGFNGWVIGNLLLGGLVGIIIDTATANATGYDDVIVSLLPKQPEAPAALPEAPMALKEETPMS